MDIGFFLVGATIGTAVGLVLRRNKVHYIKSYYESDMGAIGKKNYYEKEKEIIETLDKSMRN